MFYFDIATMACVLESADRISCVLWLDSWPHAKPSCKSPSLLNHQHYAQYAQDDLLALWRVCPMSSIVTSFIAYVDWVACVVRARRTLWPLYNSCTRDS